MYQLGAIQIETGFYRKNITLFIEWHYPQMKSTK